MKNVKATDTASIEVARLKKVEHELETRLRQQAAITELSQQALASTDLGQFMEDTVRRMAEILEVELCKILELLPNENKLLLKAGFGWPQELTGQAWISAGPETQAGYTLLKRDPVIVPDLNAEQRFIVSDLLSKYGVVSGMTVVIPGKNGPYGVLGVHTTRPRDFNRDDTNFLQGVANLLASAIERIRAEEALRSSRDQLEVILQSVADGITVQDQTGTLIYANQAAARLTGYPTAEDLLKTSPAEILKDFELLDDQGQPLPIERLPGRRALQAGVEEASNVRFRSTKTNQERWSVIKSKPVVNQAGGVEVAVNVFQDITDLKRAEQSQRLLAEAGKLLSDTLDYSTTLSSVAKLTVPGLADWCTVHLLEEGQRLQLLAVAHADPLKVDLARRYQELYPPSSDADSALVKALRTGRPELFPNITDELLQATIHDPNQLSMIRELGLRSSIIVPLVARGRSLGAISLIWAESGRTYDAADVALLEELARRAAIAIDNARLYQEAQTLNAELEARVSRRTAQLQTMISKLREEIAERRKAEEALLKSEILLESLFESAPDAIVLVNSEGIIVRVNSGAEKMFGYSRDELTGLSASILLPERLRQNPHWYQSVYLTEPKTRPIGVDLELFGRRKDGQELPVDIMLSPVKTEEGILIISAIRDITRRKEAEKALRQREAELAEVQRRLIDSVEAERLHLSQELHDGPIQDLYAVTYQLKDMAQILEEASHQDSIAQEVGDGLSSSVKLTSEVIQRLRFLCGELRPPALTPFGLEKAIEAHLEQVHLKYPDLQIHSELVPDGQAIPEPARLALYRIYQHAMSNVIRHAEAKNVIIRFQFNDTQCTLEIEDDGCGFNLPSRWVDLARSGHLGLVGTVERAEAIGGDLKIESTPGKGTRVLVIVPLAQAQMV